MCGRIVYVQEWLDDSPNMTAIRSERYIIALAIVFTVALWIWYANYLKLSTIGATMNKDNALHTNEKSGHIVDWTTVSTRTSVNVVSPALFDSRNETFECKTTGLMNMTFPICHYTAETDDTVSGLLLRGTYFEADEVKRFLRLLCHDRRLQLIDIGANVGLYSLPAARVTHVLAIEPNWRSMSRLAKGVILGAVSSNITLIHNAVSDVRATLNMGVHPSNQGNAFLINTTKCKATPINLPCNTLSPIRTILLNDLLPLMRVKAALLKVDVEGHEANIFTNPSAGQFFDQVDIPLVYMEWNLCKRKSVDIVQRLLDFFYRRNYSAFDKDNLKLEKHYSIWPDNVFFTKLTYVHF